MSSTYKHHTKQLEISERRSVRIALGVSRWTTNDDLYELAGIEPLGDRIQALRHRAITKFDHNSKGLKDLETLKLIIGTQPDSADD